jgi:hypothetical protein
MSVTSAATTQVARSLPGDKANQTIRSGAKGLQPGDLDADRYSARSGAKVRWGRPLKSINTLAG